MSERSWCRGQWRRTPSPFRRTGIGVGQRSAGGGCADGGAGAQSWIRGGLSTPVVLGFPRAGSLPVQIYRRTSRTRLAPVRTGVHRSREEVRRLARPDRERPAKISAETTPINRPGTAAHSTSACFGLRTFLHVELHERGEVSWDHRAQGSVLSSFTLPGWGTGLVDRVAATRRLGVEPIPRMGDTCRAGPWMLAQLRSWVGVLEDIPSPRAGLR